MQSFYQPTDVFIHEETKEYPITADALSRRHVIGFGLTIPGDFIRDNGYAVVRSVPYPKGDIVTEVFPTKTGDEWVRTYEVREFSYEEKEAQLTALKAAAEQERKFVQDETLTKGCSFYFGEEHGVQHIQLRTVDRTNITGLSIKALRNPEHTDVFCTYENKVIPLGEGQVHELADAALAGYTAIMAASWVLRTQIENAETANQIPTRAAMEKAMKQEAESIARIPEPVAE